MCFIEYDPDENKKKEMKTIISLKTNDFEDLIKKRETEIYFCLDKSGSMYNDMETVI